MYCPNCGASDEVYRHYAIRVKELKSGSLRHRRQCWKCGKRFNTIEYYVPDEIIKHKRKVR